MKPVEHLKMRISSVTREGTVLFFVSFLPLFFLQVFLIILTSSSSNDGMGSAQ